MGEIYTCLYLILLVLRPTDGLFMPIAVIELACSNTFVVWPYQCFKSH